MKTPIPPSPIGTEKLIATCGHPVVFDLYAKDPFRDGRRQKTTSRACPACRQTRHATEVAAIAARKVKKALRAQKVQTDRPRLPDGARFSAVYDADAMQWAGTLTIDGVAFMKRTGGIKPLLDGLDDAYRAHQERLRDQLGTLPADPENPDPPSAA